MIGFLTNGLAMLVAAAAAQPQTAGPNPPSDAPAIVITGTRIQTPNRKSASPVQSVRGQDFTLTGVANVEQTLNQLPQLSPSFTTTSNNPGTGAATLDLRGLGSVRTLILVNGRRWIADDAGQIPEVDVNTIPAALIDRVDIVTGGASAVYGSDAITGVINFVLKNKLKGIQLEARENLTQRRDGAVGSADLTLGTSFVGGKGNLLLSGGWLKQGPVFQADRAFSRFTLANACVFKGPSDKFGASSPADSEDCLGDDVELGLIYQGSGFIPEGRISRGLFVPVGDDGRLQRVNARFAPGGSITRFFAPTDSYNYAPANYLRVPLRRLSGNLLASFALSDHFEPYTELSVVRTESSQQFAPAPVIIGSGADSVDALLINLDNPYLSAQGRQVLDINLGVDSAGRTGIIRSPVGSIINPAYAGDADGFVTLNGRVFRSRLSGLGPRQVRNDRKAYRGLGGIRGKISSNWSYDAFYSRSHVSHSTQFFNSASERRLQQAMLARIDPASGQVVCIDLANGCVPINIFGQQDISNAAAAFLRIAPVERTKVDEQVAEASVNGPLLELPAGSLKTAFGTSWRKTSYVFTPDRSFEDGDSLGFLASTAAAGATSVVEFFGEALVPLLSKSRFSEELSTELGARYSHYDSVGGVWTWKAMANWSPVPRLRFRAGLQHAVRAPNARELYEEQHAESAFVLDPCAPIDRLVQTPAVITACARNGAAALPFDNYDALAHTGGSTSLKAETARTLTVGAVIQPLSWLDAAIDYYDISIRDAIAPFGGGGAFIVAGCIAGNADPADPLCRAYTRNADGFVADVYIPTANLARLTTRGIDWQVNAHFRLLSGLLQLSFSGTRLLAADVRVNPNLAPLRCAGMFGPPCGNTILGTANPKWKLFDQGSWTIGPLTWSVRHRYFSATKDATYTLNTTLNQPPPTSVPAIARRLESRHYLDASVALKVSERYRLTFGVNNLTDRIPSLVGSQQIQDNTDPSLYDVLGRRFFVSVSAQLR